MWFAIKDDGLPSPPVRTSPSAKPRMLRGCKSRRACLLKRPTAGGMKNSVEFLTSFNNAVA